jgi:HicB family
MCLMARRTRTTIRLPASLKKAAEEFAAKDGVSVNQYIALALAEKIGARGAAEFFAERGMGGNPQRAVALLEGRPE